MNNLHDNVERWLLQENYSFNEIKTNEDSFKIIIKNADGFGNNIEIFDFDIFTPRLPQLLGQHVL